MDGTRWKKVASQVAMAVAGGLVAVTLTGGGPAGAFNVPNNSVTSAKIVNGTIQGIDIKDQTIAPRDISIGAVTNARLGADAVTTDKVADGTITGADVQADSLGSSDIQNLHGTDLQSESLTGTQIVESTLGQVRSAALGGIGRSAARHPACDPESETFVDCGYTTLTLPSSSRVLILGRLEVQAEIGADLGQGVCRLVTNVGVVAGSSANVPPMSLMAT